MDEKKPTSIDDLCKNIILENNNNNIIINNENELLNYIKKINEIVRIFEKNFAYTDDNKKKEEKNIKKFIPLFGCNNFMYYDTISNHIINTVELPNNIEYNELTYNNVFILNNILENKSQFCFEIKLGHGLWDNISLKNDEEILNNKYYKIPSLRIGILKINEKNMKDISEYLSFCYPNEITSKTSWNFIRNEFDDKLIEKYKNFKKYIFFCEKLNQIIVPVEKNGKKINRLIHKNDNIGVVINNSEEHIEIKTYVNGILVLHRVVPRISHYNNESYLDIDDDYYIEEKKMKNILYIPFIELGPNNSIFIKDKPNNNDNNNNEIISNEKMEFYEKYISPPLNYFPKGTYEIQKITDLYLKILNIIGSLIFEKYPNKIDEYFKELITFFYKYVFNNKIILKNRILTFLTNGINLDIGDIKKFKENLKILFQFINLYEKKNENKNENKLVELILSLLVELIIENNFNLLNNFDLDINDIKKNEQIKNLKKNKFTIFFLLFDSFMKELNNNKNVYMKDLFFSNQENFMNFCYAIFNSGFYKDSFDSIEYLKSFIKQNNNFDKNKFIEINFNKSISQNNEIKLFNDIIQDYKFIFQNIIKNISLQKKNEINLFFKFISNYSRTEDNISIINFIIIQLIQNYFENETTNLNKEQIDKLVYINYLNINTSQFITKDDENTFYGKYNVNNANQKYKSLFGKNFNTNEIKDALIFELILNSISNYYQNFSLKEKNAKNIIELINKNINIDLEKGIEINKINHMVEFYQLILGRNFYLNLGNFGYYLVKIMRFYLTKDYLDIIPYKSYLNNILFILDFFYLRCSFINEKNLIEVNEPRIISSIIENIFKYIIEFLGKTISKINRNKFTKKEEYEEMISLHIQILIKVLMFNVGVIKNPLPDDRENLISIFKNLLELYNNNTYTIIYNNINSLIEFLYYYERKEHINGEIKKIFFNDIMAKEIEDFLKMKDEDEKKKNNYIEETMYYNIFIIIYKRVKNIRDSLKEILGFDSFFRQDLFYEKKYIIKFTQILNILYNFLKENKLDIFYDVHCFPFLKINSFICKTFKILYSAKVFKKLNSIYEKNNKIILNFFSQFFFLLSGLLSTKENFDYKYKISKNRKGFHFEEFKLNFEKYFGYSDFKMMIDFLDILFKSFKIICKEDDTLKEEDVDDNSIEIDQRDSCPICLNYTDEKDVHLNICNHVYHLSCLKLQLEKQINRCSLCKRPITGIKEDPNFKVNINSDNHNHSSLGLFDFNSNNNANNIFLNNNLDSNFNSLFGNNIARSNNLFRNPNNNSNRTHGLFINFSSNTSSLFGNSNNRDNNNISLFETSNNNQNNSLFGNNNNNAGNLFGNNNNNNLGLFGNNNRNNNTYSGLFRSINH